MSVQERMKIGPAGALALNHAISISAELRAIHKELQIAREMRFGLFHFEMLFGGVATGAELSILGTEPIPQGYVFIPEHIAAKAPEGAQLELFENSNTPTNFLEVITNIQTFANQVGGLIIEGPTNLLAVVTKMKASGNVTISVSGLLVPKVIAETPAPDALV